MDEQTAEILNLLDQLTDQERDDFYAWLESLLAGQLPVPSPEE